jgi:peptidoglycan hydrolase CwlO-like protein
MEPPVFVKISKYKELAAVLKKLQERLDATDKTIDQLTKLKEEEDRRIQEWHENLELVRGKLSAVGEAMHQR